MSGCVLRVHGADLDLETLLSTAPIPPLRTWVRGEPRGRSGALGLQPASGATFAVGRASAEDLPAQIEEALHFLQMHRGWLPALATLAGVETRVVDMATQVPPTLWASRVFPAALLGLLGAFNIDLCVSLYPAQDDDTDAAPA